MFTTKRTFTLVLLLMCLISFQARSTSYTTINSGNYSDPSIWSTDGGYSSCSCAPATTLNGDTVTIDHDIILSSNLTVQNGAKLFVTLWGTLDASSKNLLVLDNASLNLSGDCNFTRITNGMSSRTNGGTININGAIVGLSGQVELYSGTMLVSGYLYQTSGNITISPNATINFINGGKFESFGGNINNSGNIDICIDCCVTTSGNWTIEASGIVSGSGSAISTGGNMRNFGVFSPAITWCSAGFDTGMSSVEDCGVSQTICSYFELPVELSGFSGTGLDGINELSWITESEKDCATFKVKKSEDGYIWINIGSVQCSGNSTTKRFYKFRDLEVTSGISYYRLEQIDLDGSIRYSPPISISSLASNEVTAYPNPIRIGDMIYISGISGDGTLHIRNTAGILVQSNEISLNSGESAILNSKNLESGLYIVEFLNGIELQSTKFIVR